MYSLKVSALQIGCNIFGNVTTCLGAVWREEDSFGCLEAEQRTLWQQLYTYSCELLAPSMKVRACSAAGSCSMNACAGA